MISFNFIEFCLILYIYAYNDIIVKYLSPEVIYATFSARYFIECFEEVLGQRKSRPGEPCSLIATTSFA